MAKDDSEDDRDDDTEEFENTLSEEEHSNLNEHQTTELPTQSEIDKAIRWAHNHDNLEASIPRLKPADRLKLKPHIQALWNDMAIPLLTKFSNLQHESEEEMERHWQAFNGVLSYIEKMSSTQSKESSTSAEDAFENQTRKETKMKLKSTNFENSKTQEPRAR